VTSSEVLGANKAREKLYCVATRSHTRVHTRCMYAIESISSFGKCIVTDNNAVEIK